MYDSENEREGMVYPDIKLTARKKRKEEIQRIRDDVSQYLANGGKITVIESPVICSPNLDKNGNLKATLSRRNKHNFYVNAAKFKSRKGET